MSGGGGIANLGLGGTASLTINGSTLVGNLARQGLGGAIINLNQGGEADVSIVFDDDRLDDTHPAIHAQPQSGAVRRRHLQLGRRRTGRASLGPGTLVVGNEALIDGGGVFNADGATLLTFGATILQPPRQHR